MSERELEPCPFCGGTAEIGYVQGETARVECRGDDCLMAEVFTDRLPRAEAIAAWNRRSPSRQSILEEAAKERDRLIRAASALKFAPYPAHGSGYVMTVEGDLGEFQAAIRSLHGKAPDKEGEAG